MIAQGIAMGTNALGSMIGGIGSAVSASAAVKQEDRNYLQRKRLLRYQKETQRKVWDREDTAVSRRMADMKSAGINPNLAAGSAAASSGPVAMKAPFRDTGPTERSGAVAGQMVDRFANIAQTMAQTDYLNTQKEYQKVKNEIQSKTKDYQIASYRYGSQSAQAKAKYDQATLQTNINRAISELKTINENRRQSIKEFGPKLQETIIKNKISRKELNYLRRTITARISGTQTSVKLQKQELKKMRELLKPLVGIEESQAILYELQIEDFRNLPPAKQKKRVMMWNNIWSFFNTVTGGAKLFSGGKK